MARAGAGGHGRGGRRDAHGGTDASRVPARRLFGGSPPRPFLALLPLAASCRARAGVGASGRLPGASARRRAGRPPGAVHRRDVRDARLRRGCVAPPDGPLGPALGSSCRGRAGAADPPGPPPAPGPLRAPRHTIGLRSGARPVPRRAGTRALRRERRPLHGAHHPVAYRRIRAYPRHRGACGRVAGRAGRLAAHRRGTGRVPACARRRDHDRNPGREHRGARGISGRPPQPDAAPGAARRRAPASARIPAGT